MKKIALINLILLAGTQAFGAYVREDQLKHPPQHHSMSQMQGWLNQTLQQVNPQLKLKLLRTSDWANYVNNNHFVPLTFEGVPPGYQFDYNWDAINGPKKRLPTAEVTETGEFMFWGNKCNFFSLKETECRALINAVVRHEARHYTQWKKVAYNALKEINAGVAPPFQPLNLTHLSSINGAVIAFLRVWGDGRHYQCREVEDYVGQIHDGEIPAGELPGRLVSLKNYYQGCRASKWAAEFATSLIAARKILNNGP